MVLLLLPYAEEGELFHLSHDLFYRSSVENILTCSSSSWFGNSTAVQRHNLNRIMRTAEEIIGVLLPQLQDIHPELCSHKASRTPNILLMAGLHSGKIQKHKRLLSTVILSVCTKLKYLSLLIFNCSICLNPVSNYLLV